MIPPKKLFTPIPENEAARLKSLESYRVMDTLPEKELDDIVQLASQICETPVALVSLIDSDRQWFKARQGVDAVETPRDVAFCAHTITGTSPLVVEDALLDERFRENPAVVGGPMVRFYAGSPLTTSDGFNLGSLCVVDQKPRKLSAAQMSALEALARQVISNFERRKLEFEAREREQFLNQVLGALPVLVSYIDTNYRYKHVNAAYERWYKIPAEQIVGRTIAEVAGSGAFESVRAYVDRAFRGERQTFEHTFAFRDGEIQKSVQCHYIPDLQSDGKVHGIFGVVNDVTSLKEAERTAIVQGQQIEKILQQALSTERAFRTIFDNAPMGIIQIDKNLRFISTNPAFQNILGYSSTELSQMTILDVTHPDDVGRTVDATRISSGSKESVRRIEKRYLHKSGRTIWVLVNARAVWGENNDNLFHFSVIEDITEFRKAEDDLKLAQAQLISSAKMASLGEMASGVAHEINNPLAIIYAKVGQMSDRLQQVPFDTERTKGDLAVIEKTVGRIAKIVKGLRSFSRNSSGDPSEKVMVLSLINETLELCKVRFKYEDVEIRTVCDKDFMISCRPSEIAQIIINLVSNAFDAIKCLEEKWISIEIRGTEESVILLVSDSGTGIPAATADRMMEPFFSTKDVGEGTGLGLSISKGIAEAHRGTLKYETVGGHTAFILELPKGVSSADAERKQAA